MIAGLHPAPRNEPLEVLPRIADVELRRHWVDIGAADDDHDVRVGREDIDEGREARVPDLHALKLRLGLPAAQLELLDDVADLLEPVRVEPVRIRGSASRRPRPLRQEAAPRGSPPIGLIQAGGGQTGNRQNGVIPLLTKRHTSPI